LHLFEKAAAQKRLYHFTSAIYGLEDVRLKRNSSPRERQNRSMQRINRRVVLGGIAAFSIGRAASAATPEELSVAGDDGGVALTRYATDQAGKRAGVVILHGSRGIELKPRAYQRYADALNASGIDAHLARYFTAADLQALDLKTSTAQQRDTYRTERFAGWARSGSASRRS